MEPTFYRTIINKAGNTSVVGMYFEEDNLYCAIGTAKYKMRKFDYDKYSKKIWDGCWNVGRKEDYEKIFFDRDTAITIVDADSNKKYIIKSNTIKELQKEGCVYEYESIADDDRIHLFVPSDLCREKV